MLSITLDSFLNSMKGISSDDQESPKGIPYMCVQSRALMDSLLYRCTYQAGTLIEYGAP
jgi:hypothetical protein